MWWTFSGFGFDLFFGFPAPISSLGDTPIIYIIGGLYGMHPASQYEVYVGKVFLLLASGLQVDST